jgi:adenosyl cobinamide kinase/adenosyl cobinamide phosphate guanylyltransferase
MSREKFLQVNINKLLNEKHTLKKEMQQLKDQIKYLEQINTYDKEMQEQINNHEKEIKTSKKTKKTKE